MVCVSVCAAVGDKGRLDRGPGWLGSELFDFVLLGINRPLEPEEGDWKIKMGEAIETWLRPLSARRHRGDGEKRETYEKEKRSLRLC